MLSALKSDEDFAAKLEQIKPTQYQRTLRARLLSSAVRVESSLLPHVTEAFEKLKHRVGIDEPMEAYVYQESAINAFVTRGHSYTFVALSSFAVNQLTEAELEFVIGHEFGHAIFGHIDVPAGYLLETGTFDVRQRMQMLAWQRACEISADRCGLICCGSLDVAATAMFKTLSGLGGEISIKPSDFAKQWDHLVDEVISGGEDEQWQMTHPFPPLRMQAMMSFWKSGHTGYNADSNQSSDAEVEKLLAMMDPLARENDAADPILVNFYMWGGLYIALANGEFHVNEQRELESITSTSRLAKVLEDGMPESEYCLEKFSECLGARNKKMSAVEINRIVNGLLQIAVADGNIDDLETEAFRKIGEKLNLTPYACDFLISKHLETKGLS